MWSLLPLVAIYTDCAHLRITSRELVDVTNILCYIAKECKSFDFYKGIMLTFKGNVGAKIYEINLSDINPVLQDG